MPTSRCGCRQLSAPCPSPQSTRRAATHSGRPSAKRRTRPSTSWPSPGPCSAIGRWTARSCWSGHGPWRRRAGSADQSPSSVETTTSTAVCSIGEGSGRVRRSRKKRIESDAPAIELLLDWFQYVIIFSWF